MSRMVVTDLDGTLFQPGSRISPADLDTLHRLAGDGIPCVVATGRSLYSARRVLPPDFPIRYLVFSSGAGLLDWPSGELLKAASLTAGEVEAAARVLLEAGLDFMVHSPIPDNHHFTWFASGKDNPDFRRRCRIYQDFARAGDPRGWLDGDSTEDRPRFAWDSEACQLLAIDPDGETSGSWRRIRDLLPSLKVIRATSPLDGRSTWIEIFPAGVSKARGAAWLAARHGAGPHQVLAVGNDYNDLDLLEWAGTSFVIDTAPKELLERFRAVPAAAEDGFSRAVEIWSRAGGS